MFSRSKKRITIELNERCFNPLDLTHAVIDYLTNKGKYCKALDTNIIIIDDKKYALTEKNINVSIATVQQAVLTEIRGD